MATLTGGKIRTPRGQLPWMPAAAVAKAYQFVTRMATDKYRCLGVVGNAEHLEAAWPGDHTPYSTHDVWLGGKHYVPKRGWIYAGDFIVPEMAKFERWFLARLRAGYYKSIKYFNILGRHWHRTVVKAGVPFAKHSWSGDEHLHLSVMPGAEYSPNDIFGDYEFWRVTGRNRPVPVAQRPKPSPRKATPVKRVDAAARKLPALRRGSTGTPVKIAQASLVTRGVWPKTNASARAHITGVYAAATENAIRSFQRRAGLPVTGVVDARTWAALAPDHPATVTRGSDGFYAMLMQCMLIARGFNPGFVDGRADQPTIDAMKRFQVAKKVKNSVVRGRGDGIGSTNTWVALFTL